MAEKNEASWVIEPDANAEAHVTSEEIPEDKSVDAHELNATAEVDIGSEELPDVKCTTCDKNNPAKVFCCECHKLLCQTCLQFHDMFLKKHTLEVVSVFHATQKCQDHPEELLETYCRNHKAAICHICEEQKHSECVILQKLHKAAQGMGEKQRKKCIYDLETANEMIDKVLEYTKKSASDLTLAIEDSKGKIEDLYKQLTEAAGNWKNQALKEIAKREKTLLEEKDFIAKKLQKGKSEVKEIQRKLEDNTSNKGDLFCYVKKGENIVNKIDLPLRQEPMCIKVVSNIGNVVKVINNTALIVDGVDNKETSKLMTKANIKTKEDKSTCHVTDICQLSSGEFLIADFRNRRVKRLNSSYQPVQVLELPAPPKALCEVKPGLAAVSMDSSGEKIMLLQISEDRIEKTSISNNEIKNETEGIASFGDQLYVCENIYGMYGLFSVSCQIGIYDIKGKLIRKLTHSKLTNAFSITHDINKDVSYISDSNKDRIQTMDLNGNILTTISCDSSIKRPMGLCRGQNGDIFVAGHDSSSIGLLTMGGIKQQMSESDGLKNPRALCYDMLNDKLLVGCDDSDFIHVYTV